MRPALTSFVFMCLCICAGGAPAGSQHRAPAPTNPEKAQIILVSAAPDKKLERQFMGETGWTGADGAGSIRLSAQKTLWLFGDTFIGKVENGRRRQTQFINNSAAWQNTGGDDTALRFFWRNEGGVAGALLKPPQKNGQFYWPCDGTLLGDRLILLMRRVQAKMGAGGPFDFDVLGCDLVCVENPQAEPTAWKYSAIELPLKQGGIDAASAVCADDQYLYVFGRRLGAKPGQLVLARLAIKELATPTGVRQGWQYFCDTANGGAWRRRPQNLRVLFGDAAPEMSISRWPGMRGYVALYMSPMDVPGNGRTIFVRRADHLWGPWSARTQVCDCPAPPAGVLVYNARSHPELSGADGVVPVTFCRNSLRNADHEEHPDLYRPQAIAVKLRPGAISPIRKKP